MSFIPSTYSNNEGWQALGIAIIRQAADDWRTAQRRIRRPYGDTKENIDMIRETERYIRSGYTEFYTGANGQYVLRKLKEELNEQ